MTPGSRSPGPAAVAGVEASESAGRFVGQGLAYLKQNLPQERLSMAVTAVATAEKPLQTTIEYCRERQVFGQPVGSHQANRFTIAEMLAEVGRDAGF